MPHWSHEALFTGRRLEDQPARNERRPLMEMSNFVVQELPNRLVAIEAGEEDVTQLSKDAEQLARSAPLRLISFLEKNRVDAVLLSRLDILMLDAAIAKAGGTVGPNLNDLIARLAVVTDRPEALTYEDVVINNPETDIRTFTTGMTGEAERSFYVGHQYVEQALGGSVPDLKNIADYPNLPIEIIIDMLLKAEQAMKDATAISATIMNKMTSEQFQYGFRRYLSTHPHRNIRGPSGAFTASIPLFELYLAGEAVPEQFKQYIIDNLKYYPLDAQRLLVDAIFTQHTVRFGLNSHPDGQEGLVIAQRLSTALRAFRSMHINAAAKHVPEAMAGNDAGTGGEIDVPTFLRERRDQTHGFNN